MSSNSPCAVYNFYNCCDPSSASKSSSFIWQSGNILDPYTPPGSTQPERLSLMLALSNAPDADLKTYQGLMPLHRNARLMDISLIRFAADNPVGPPYTSTIMFSLVVLDFNGTVIRTISAAPINYQSAPLVTWIPISLSTVPGDLDIPAGQLVAGELTFGTPLAAGQLSIARYQLSGTGMLF